MISTLQENIYLQASDPVTVFNKEKKTPADI